jgi:ABC-type uncharacterized transport system substrate-binding protein
LILNHLSCPAILRRPGGNITGFTVLQASIAGKYLEILKEMVPQLARAAIMYNPNSVPGGGTFFSRPFIESATKLKVQPITAEVHDRSEIENAVMKLGRESGSGLILVPDNFMSVHRDAIISLTAQFRIPAIYPYRYFAEAGGLVSYGVDAIDQFRIREPHSPRRQAGGSSRSGANGNPNEIYGDTDNDGLFGGHTTAFTGSGCGVFRLH